MHSPVLSNHHHYAGAKQFPFPTATASGEPKHMPLLLPRLVLPAVASLQSPTEPEAPNDNQDNDDNDSQHSATTAMQSMLTLLQHAQSAATGHKRSLSSEDDAEDDNDERDRTTSTQASSPTAWTHKKPKLRKPTYLVRKEEKDLLQLQVQQLEAQLAYLRERSGIVDWQSQEFQMQQKRILNEVLRENVRNQQLAVLSAQSVVSELMSLGERCPLDSPIRLSRDWASRRETLMALKTPKLYDAQRLLEKRTQFVDLSRERREDLSYVAENGDYCSVAFQSVPLRGAEGVKQVYDQLHGCLESLERSVGDAIGAVVTCESDDNWDKTILHRRLVHSSVRDVLIESNYVVFSEFVDDERSKSQWSRDRVAGAGKTSGGVGKELGVIVIDYVNDDELFPYRSSQCMRQDVSGIISLRAVACTPPKSSGGSATQDHESVVVITRWLLLRMRHNSELSVSRLQMQELKARIQQVGDAIVQAVQESAVALPPSSLRSEGARAAATLV